MVDIGAGNFQWSHALAKFINEQPDFTNDFTLHIFGLRVESSSLPEFETDNKCKIYNFGCCKIEELEDENGENTILIRSNPPYF